MFDKDGAGERIRTLDPRITSAPLYHLSYAGLLMREPKSPGVDSIAIV